MSPTFDFCCQKCNEVIAEIRTYEDRLRPAACPVCGEDMLFMFPAPVFHFAGGSPTAKHKHQVTSQKQFLEGMDDDE